MLVLLRPDGGAYVGTQADTPARLQYPLRQLYDAAEPGNRATAPCLSFPFYWPMMIPVFLSRSTTF